MNSDCELAVGDQKCGKQGAERVYVPPPFQTYKEVIVHKLAGSTSVPTPKLDSVSGGQTLSFLYIHGTNVFFKRKKYVYECLFHVYPCLPCSQKVLRVQKRVLEPLEPEL